MIDGGEPVKESFSRDIILFSNADWDHWGAYE